jgi:hypothetical protein
MGVQVRDYAGSETGSNSIEWTHLSRFILEETLFLNTNMKIDKDKKVKLQLCLTN